MSPSTLSRQIQKLERDLGRQLFERDNRTVLLTDTGSRFLQYARDTVDRWNEFKQSLSSEADLKGEISMYCSVTASYSVLPGLLSDFRLKHPNIEIKLRTGDPASSIEKVSHGEVDIVVAARPDKLPPRLEFITIAESPLLFIAPLDQPDGSRFSKHSEIDWASIPMIIPEKGLARKRIDLWFRQKGIKPNIYAQVLGNEGIVSMVNLGFGIGVVPDLVIKNSPFEDRVKTITVANPLTPYLVGVCTQKRKLRNPLIHAFWNVALNEKIRN